MLLSIILDIRNHKTRCQYVTPLFNVKELLHKNSDQLTITFPKPPGTPQFNLEHRYVSFSRSLRTTSPFSQNHNHHADLQHSSHLHLLHPCHFLLGPRLAIRRQQRRVPRRHNSKPLHLHRQFRCLLRRILRRDSRRSLHFTRQFHRLIRSKCRQRRRIFGYTRCQFRRG